MRLRRTGATPLIGLGAIGLAAGFLLELLLSSAGSSLVIPPLTLPITLVVLSGVVVGFAIPIRRAVTADRRRHVDPFVALRTVSLARASSLAGALGTGFGLGILAFLLSRQTLPGVASVWLAAATAIGALVLMVAGLVAEHLCRLPKDDDDDDPAAAAGS